MTRCKMSRAKRRTPMGRGKAHTYKRGMRGHSWKKLFKNGLHIGRQCTKCKKKVLNMRGVYETNTQSG